MFVVLTFTSAPFFVYLSFLHFVFDWGFQTHREAMRKSTDWVVRLRHCTTYAALMTTMIILLNVPIVESLLIGLWLLATHFIIDTYLPVALWAKYIRRAPQFFNVPLKTGMYDFMSTSLGLILAITMDQILHLLSIVPVAYLLGQRFLSAFFIFMNTLLKMNGIDT